MQGRTPTKKEAEYMAAARSLGCIACIVSRRIRPFTVPEEYTAIHHLDGKTKPGAHFLTIPLCPCHHQDGPLRLHGNRKGFEEAFGTEEELLRKTKEILYRTGRYTE